MLLQTLQQEENDKLVMLVNDKLGEGSYEYETLLDFEDNSRYILVSGENCYLVFDTVLNDYVEFSKTDSSFYDELDDDSEKIYLAPTYSFYKKNGFIYNLYDDREVTAFEVIGVDNIFGTPIDNMIDQSGNLDIGASIFEDHHGAKSGIMHLGYLVHNPAAAIHDLLLYWWRKSHEK